MKNVDITEVVTNAIEEKILKEWRHDGFIGGFTSSYINFVIDDKEYVLWLREVLDGTHFTEYIGEEGSMNNDMAKIMRESMVDAIKEFANNFDRRLYLVQAEYTRKGETDKAQAFEEVHEMLMKAVEEVGA